MHSYEYKSLKVPGRFRNSEDLTKLDTVINDSASRGWELSTSTAVSYGFLNSEGKTSGIILTFRREKS